MSNKNKILHWSIATALLIGALGGAEKANAFGVNGEYVDDSRCDAIPDTRIHEELGGPDFPMDELIEWTVESTTNTTCNISGDGGANDWLVSITNRSGRKWNTLFFVADSGAALGNADGTIGGDNAFKIDASGINNSLVESGSQNGMFEIDETWTFLVTDFEPGFEPVFNSQGINGASPSFGGDGSTASIVAPVPEPLTILGSVTALGVGSLLKREHSRKQTKGKSKN